MKKILFVVILLVVVLTFGLVLATRAEPASPEANELYAVFMQPYGIWAYMGPNAHVMWAYTNGDCSIYAPGTGEHYGVAMQWNGYDYNYYYWDAMYWHPSILHHDPRQVFVLEWCRVYTENHQYINYSINTPLTWNPDSFIYTPAMLAGYPEP